MCSPAGGNIQNFHSGQLGGIKGALNDSAGLKGSTAKGATEDRQAEPGAEMVGVSVPLGKFKARAEENILLAKGKGDVFRKFLFTQATGLNRDRIQVPGISGGGTTGVTRTAGVDQAEEKKKNAGTP